MPRHELDAQGNQIIRQTDTSHGAPCDVCECKEWRYCARCGGWWNSDYMPDCDCEQESSMTDHEILMELLKHVRRICLETLPSCYVNHIPNPDVYDDAIEFIEDVVPELREASRES
jgi:hypothetical protein